MAVYTEISDEELGRYLQAYDIGTLTSCKGIAEGVENSNYLLGTTKGHYILTLYEKRVAVNDLPFFLGLIEHLSRRGLNCPQPIHMKNGEILGELASRPSAIVSFLEGMWVRRPQVAHCEQLGTALAKLHEASEGFAIRRPNALSVEGWQTLWAQNIDQSDKVQAGLKGEISEELNHLVANWPKELPEGVIHADLFPDNVFFLNDQLSGLIDFYFACNDFYVYDLAICLNSWCFEQDGAYNVTKGRALVSAYHAERPLSEAEIAAFPLLCRGSALRFLLTRLHDWLRVPPGALVVPKDPLEYYRKMRFHRSVSSLADYGVDLKS